MSFLTERRMTLRYQMADTIAENAITHPDWEYDDHVTHLLYAYGELARVEIQEGVSRVIAAAVYENYRMHRGL